MANTSLRRRIIGGSLIGLGSIAAALGVFSSQIWPQSDQIVAATATKVGEGYVLYPEGTPLTDDEAGAYANSRYLVIPRNVLTMVDPQVELTFSVMPIPQPPAASPNIIVVAGRQIDVAGWLGGLPYTEVTGMHSWEQLATRVGPAADSANESASGATGQLADEPSQLLGNDMWLLERTGGDVTLNWEEIPDDPTLVLLATNNTDASHPPTLTLTWPREVTAPYQWPLIGAGLATILLGAAMLLSRSRHHAVVVTEAPAPAASVLPEVPVPVTNLGTGIYVEDVDDTFWRDPEPETEPTPATLADEPGLADDATPITDVDTELATPAAPGEPPVLEYQTQVEPLPDSVDHWATYRPKRPVLPPLPDLLAVLPDDDEPLVYSGPSVQAEPEAPIPPQTQSQPPAQVELAAPVEPLIVESEPEPVVIEPVPEPVVVETVRPAPAPHAGEKPKRQHRFSLRRRTSETRPATRQSAPATGQSSAPNTSAPTAFTPESDASASTPTTPSSAQPTTVAHPPEPLAPPSNRAAPAAEPGVETTESGEVPVYTPPVSRSALREARRVAEETGDTQLLDSLTGAIQAVPEPDALTSQIPVSTANWRAVWGLENTSRRTRRTVTGEVEAVSESDNDDGGGAELPSEQGRNDEA